MFDGAYPPGVTGKMIDDYFREGQPPETCESCTFYEERSCGYICSVLEAEYSETAIGDMTDEVYMKKFGKDKDNYCSDYKRWED